MRTEHSSSYQHIYRYSQKSSIRKWVLVLCSLGILVLFLPWTQNIRSQGTVTALRQEQRLQQINTVIGGRVEQWFVKEGDYVQKGDTLLRLSEIKSEYMDPDLLQRTKEQMQAKEQAVTYYSGKIAAAESQVDALRKSLDAKMSQLQSKGRQLQAKVRSDSMDLVAAANEAAIATLQYSRQQALYDSGLVSLTQLESRNQSYQATLAKKISAENKLYASRQEQAILQLEYSSVQQEYAEKVSKTEGDRFGSLSQMAAGQGDLAKLNSQFASYTIRNGMYYVIAPQSGQIVRARTSGIGEVVKEGEMLVHIVPERLDYAVELFVRPVDLPLLQEGGTVRFLFDGFPAIVFSGWPDASYGTYQGRVSAIERTVGENGKFKVLVQEDSTYRPWPPELRIGTGARGIALLRNVPIWYELWRNINSFPPDFYRPQTQKEKKK